MLRTRILAAATAALLALGMAAGGASPAIAANPNSSGGSTSQSELDNPCDQYGYTKIDSPTGSFSGDWGSMVWDGTGLTLTTNPGWTIDLCLKGGNEDNVFVDAATTGFFNVTAGSISHIGWANPTFTPTQTTPDASSVPATCDVPTGTITFAVVTGIASYSLGGVDYAPGATTGPLPPGDYSISATATAGFVLAAGSSPFTETIGGPAEGECDEEPTIVIPAFTVVAESCPTGTSLVGGSIALDTKGGTISYVVTDSEANVVETLTGLAPGTYTVTPTAVGENVELNLDGYSADAVIAPFEGECLEPEPEVVIPAFTVADETCVSGILLEGGSIALDTKGGTVSYVVTDADDNVIEDLTDLAPGTYTVTPSPVGDVELDLEGYSDQAVVDAFDGECGSVLPITDASLAFIDPTCDERQQLDPDDFVYDRELAELTIVEVEENGDYLVVFEAIGEDTQFFQDSEPVEGRTVSEDGTVLTFTGTLDGPNEELCPDDTVIVPPVTVVDTCLEQSYTITAVEGVSYSVSVNGDESESVTFEEGEETVTITADPFDEIVVTATASEGFLLPESYEPFEYTFAFDDECLPTGPLTFATVTFTQPDCLGNPGSYTLTNGLGVIWTVDGLTVAGNTKYTPPTGSTPSIEARLAGASSEYPLGFGWDSPEPRTLWNLSFAAPTGCVTTTVTDLPTLALTGASNALGGLGVIAILIMMAGTGLVVARRREAANVQG
ncbi:MAG: hypothetical protein ACLGH5_05715 [Actinomycetes bacterium]